MTRDTIKRLMGSKISDLWPLVSSVHIVTKQLKFQRRTDRSKSGGDEEDGMADIPFINPTWAGDVLWDADSMITGVVDSPQQLK